MKMLISGVLCDSADKSKQNVYNPATGEVIDTIPAATQEDVERAIRDSVEGQREWGAIPLYKRGQILENFCKILEKNGDEIATVLTKEMGKPYREARNDIGAVTGIFRAYIAAAATYLGETMPIGAQGGKEHDFEFTVREPLGTVACIVPYNGPLVLFAYKAAPALIAGNAIVVKPASDDPLAVLMLGSLLLEAGVPAKAIQFISGSGSKIGKYISENPLVNRISFTGSTAVGIEIYEKAAKNLTHVSLELGGNAPFVLMPDGQVDVAVQEAFLGRAATLTGQVCNTSKRFIIHESLKNEFMEKLISKLKTLVMGDPFDPETTLGSLVSEHAAKEIESQIQKTVAQGARLVYGGERNGAYIVPAVLDGLTMDMEVMHDMEIFGPVFPIITFNTYEEAIEIANATTYGLGASIYTENMRTALRFAKDVQAGSVIVNGNSYYRSLLMPFGGYKKSGIGREGLFTALDEVTQIKCIVFKGML